MFKRFAALVVMGSTAALLSGCLVAESRYLKKVEESDILTAELGELNKKY